MNAVAVQLEEFVAPVFAPSVHVSPAVFPNVNERLVEPTGILKTGVVADGTKERPEMVDGHTPAPPPSRSPFAASSDEDDSVVVAVKQGIPPEFTVPATVSG